MNQQQYDQLIIVEDYLRRYVKAEILCFNKKPPISEYEVNLEKLLNAMLDYINLNDLYNIECSGELNHLRSREQYLAAKNKALQHICKINGIDYSYTAYIKDTDY